MSPNKLKKLFTSLESQSLYALMPFIGSKQVLYFIRHSSKLRSRLLYEGQQLIEQFASQQNLATETEFAHLEVKIRRLKSLMLELSQRADVKSTDN